MMKVVLVETEVLWINSTIKRKAIYAEEFFILYMVIFVDKTQINEVFNRDDDKSTTAPKQTEHLTLETIHIYICVELQTLTERINAL